MGWIESDWNGMGWVTHTTHICGGVKKGRKKGRQAFWLVGRQGINSWRLVLMPCCPLIWAKLSCFTSHTLRLTRIEMYVERCVYGRNDA